MTLQNFLIDNVTSDNIVCIGSQSQYFFIGTCADALKDIPEINKAALNQLKKRERIYSNFIKHNPTKIEELKQKLYKNGEVNIFVKKQIENREYELRAAKNNIKSMKQSVKDFKNMFDREIVEVFKRKANNDTAVIVTGDERACYWTLEEYKTKTVIEDDNEE